MSSVALKNNCSARELRTAKKIQNSGQKETVIVGTGICWEMWAKLTLCFSALLWCLVRGWFTEQVHRVVPVSLLHPTAGEIIWPALFPLTFITILFCISLCTVKNLPEKLGLCITRNRLNFKQMCLTLSFKNFHSNETPFPSHPLIYYFILMLQLLILQHSDASLWGSLLVS